MRILPLVFAFVGMVALACPATGQDLATEKKLAPLRALLNDPDDQVREKALKGLADLGPDAEPAVDEIVARLQKDKVPGVRIAALHAIDAIYFRGKGNKVSGRTVRALAAALKDSDTVVRWNAAHTLRTIGPRAGNAAEDLLEATKVDDSRMRELARRAFISDIGPYSEELSPKLLAMYCKGIDDADLEFMTIIALGRIGADAADIVPLLAELLDNKKPRHPRSRDAAVLALTDFGPAAREAVPALVKAFEESLKLERFDVRNVRNSALVAINRIGLEAWLAAAPVLSEVVQDKNLDRSFRRDAEQILKRLIADPKTP